MFQSARGAVRKKSVPVFEVNPRADLALSAWARSLHARLKRETLIGDPKPTQIQPL